MTMTSDDLCKHTSVVDSPFGPNDKLLNRREKGDGRKVTGAEEEGKKVCMDSLLLLFADCAFVCFGDEHQNPQREAPTGAETEKGG